MSVKEGPANRVVVDSENPWPGLDYFGESSQAFFHGREAESDLLLSMVRHRLLTVLYGQSGLGKSSLLQAGLFPRLRADGWLPVYIRLSHTDADGLGGRGPNALIAQTRQFIREAIADAIEKGQLVADEPGDGTAPSPMPREDESLWEYLHRRDSGLRSRTRARVAPVLVFDQFEEIFTLGRSETRTAIRQTFLRDLGDCIENRLPEYILKEMNRRDRGDLKPFENLDFERQDYRLVLSLREDYLAELHDLDHLIPSIHENQTRLLPLNGWQALDAIAIPGEALVDPVVAREIVELVAASRRGDVQEDAQEDGATAVSTNGEAIDESQLQVDPALLSMVCRELNIERQKRKELKITQQITNDLLRNTDRSILRRFYTDCFRSLPDQQSAPEVQKFVEDELLTLTGYRNMAELERAQHRLARAGVRDPAAAFQQLIDERLLRVSERPQDKTRWLELTHDVLCDVVKESRQEREAREEQERQEREEKERAVRRLAEAERQRAEAEEQARQAREREADALARLMQMRRARRLGITALVLTICFAGALCLAGFLLLGRFKTGAEAQRRSRTVLANAKERISRTNDDRHNVNALRLLARALRFEPDNAEAASLLSRLLMEKNWTPPLSPTLLYTESPLMCAGFTPDNREVVAVAQNGNLIRWRADDYSRLPDLPLLPDKTKALEVITSAAFSRDGKRILITLFPPGRENARVCNWSEHDKAYRVSITTVELKDSIRALAWSADGNSIFVLPGRFDQTNCRVFRFEGTNFKEQPSLPNVTALDLSPDDRWLATGAPGGKVQLWDAATLKPVPAGAEVQPVLEPPQATSETRYFSLAFSSNGEELAAAALREPARIWNVRSGEGKVIRPHSPQDRIVRVAFAPTGPRGRGLALGIAGVGGGMVGVVDPAQLDQFRAEPISMQDPTIVPFFRSDGTQVVTLSGAFWQSMDTVRVWDLALRKPVVDPSSLHFTGKSAPRWLSELADAVAGVRPLADDTETPVPSISELKKRYADTDVPKEYALVWDRFLGATK
jgi:WD40 repeat protein